MTLYSTLHAKAIFLQKQPEGECQVALHHLSISYNVCTGLLCRASSILKGIENRVVPLERARTLYTQGSFIASLLIRGYSKYSRPPDVSEILT